MAEHGQGLDRLAQAHFVSQDGAHLGQGELGAKCLVTTQGHIEQALVELHCVDALHQFGRKEPSRSIGVGGAGELGQHAVIEDGPGQVVSPKVEAGVGLLIDDFDRHLDLSCEAGRSCCVDDLSESMQGRLGRFFTAAPGEESADRSCLQSGRIQVDPDRAGKRHQLGVDRVDHFSDGCERAERLQQIGVLRWLGFDVEANPGRAANGVFELVSGGDELARRFGSDALDRFELVSAGLADG